MAAQSPSSAPSLPTKASPCAQKPSHPSTSRKPSFDENDERLFLQQHSKPTPDYDPCANAKITSPFYLYNHDSPRPSTDSKKIGGGQQVHVMVKDLEAQTPTSLTPTVTKEKRNSSESGQVRLWGKGTKRCMTKKRESRWKQLLPWQRLAIKLIVGFLLTGLVVGVAVGLSLRVHGGVYKSANSSSSIS